MGYKSEFDKLSVKRTSSTNGRLGLLESKNSLDVVSNQFLSKFLSCVIIISKTTDFARNWIEDNRFDTERKVQSLILVSFELHQGRV
jgi:hypothetical protein